MRILCRLPNWLGDLVMATPALRGIRRTFPRAEITWYAKPGVVTLLAQSAWFDDLIEVGFAGGPVRDGLALRERRFDRAVLFPSSWSSAITAFFAAARERYGYAEEGRGVLLTHRLRARHTGRLRPIPKVDYYLRLVRLLGVEPEHAGLQTELPDTKEARQNAARWLRDHGVGADERPVALSVGASFGRSKEWVADRWAQVGDHLLRRGERVIVYGGPKDVPAVRAALERFTIPGAIAATDVRLPDLPAHMRRAQLLISTDSGGRHIGNATNTPTIVLMGSTHPGYSENYASSYTVILKRPACWPCHLRTCPIDHRCMTRITPEEVIRMADLYLAGERPYGGQRPWLTPPGAEHPLFSGAAC